MICGIDHRPTQITPTDFGNPAMRMGLATIVHSAPHPGIADQLLGMFETSDIADRCQDRDGCQPSHSWQLNQHRNALILGAFPFQVSFNLRQLFPGKRQRIQVRAHSE